MYRKRSAQSIFNCHAHDGPFKHKKKGRSESTTEESRERKQQAI